MKKTMLSMAMVAVALAGCSNEENNPADYVPEGTPIRVNTYVADMETRAGYDESNGPSGFYISIVNSFNQKYSYDAWMAYNSTTKAWESFDAKNTSTAMPMYWAGDKNQVQVTAATFAADEMATGLGVESDQTDEAKYNSSDKLVMKTTDVTPSAQGIDVKLEHLMAKVKVEIDLGEDDDYQTNPLSKVTIGGTELKRVCDETTYAFTSLDPATVGNITPWESAFTPTDKAATPMVNAKVCYEAILVPQTVADGKFTVSFTLDGKKEFRWTSEKAVKLDSNYEYTLSLRLYGDKLLLGNVAVDTWGQKDLSGGVVEVYIPTYTATEAGHLDEAAITKALRGGTKLTIVGPVNKADVNALRNNETITYLDLTKVTAAAGYSVNNISFDSFSSLRGKLETVKMPETLTVIAYDCFYHFDNLKNVTLPDGLTSIEDRAFIGCKELKEVKLPSELTSIGELAFGSCYSLKEITIPSKVKQISKMTFSSCYNLKKIICDGPITNIGDEAFYECRDLTDLYLVECTALPAIGTDVFNFGKNVKVHLSESLYNSVTAASTTWSGATFIKD